MFNAAVERLGDKYEEEIPEMLDDVNAKGTIVYEVQFTPFSMTIKVADSNQVSILSLSISFSLSFD